MDNPQALMIVIMRFAVAEVPIAGNMLFPSETYRKVSK